MNGVQSEQYIIVLPVILAVHPIAGRPTPSIVTHLQLINKHRNRVELLRLVHSVGHSVLEALNCFGIKAALMPKTTGECDSKEIYMV